MALTVNVIPKYKGLSGSDPQIQDSNITDDGTTVYSDLPVAIAESTEPTTPGPGYCKLYVDSSNSHLKIKDDTGTVTDVTTGGGGASNWGDLGGTLSDQTDLQAALDAKQGTLTNSAGLRAALSDETGTGVAVFATSPTLVTPDIGTPSAGVLTNCTGLPIAGGGTGAASAQAAIDALTQVSGATNEHVLTKDTATGNAVFKAPSGGLFTDSSTTCYLTTTTDDLVVGANSPVSSAKLSVDGDADQRQLVVQGHSTQTDSILEVQKSDGTVVFSVTNTAGVTAGGTTAQIADTNGNELIKFTATASAVNEFTVTNNSTGSSPILSATGDDTDIDVVLTPKGAGLVKMATVPVVGTTSTQTLTNKRVTKRVVTTTDDATAVIDVDVTDVYELSAVANATTFSTTGTPTDGQPLIIRFKDAGVAKGLTWDAVFVAIGVTLPTTTVAGKWHYVGCQYNSAASKFHAIAVGAEA